ncbi:hypothetical protein SK128_001277 [Halocaridina rubra]|uniref:Uncharacterized protein n=1 Tax=Halocaridina rubra TaxID=373956 RepID=A0AAN8X7R5_HALRR
MEFFCEAETVIDTTKTGQRGTYWSLLAGMHVVAVVFISALVAAVIVLAVYHWRRYHLYKRARLIPESPYLTPPSTPTREVVAGSSMLTITEVISLKSLVLKPKLPNSLPMGRKGSSSSYSPLNDRQPEEPRHSLPNSPFLTRRVVTPSTIRRSSSQVGRFLRISSGNFRKKRRRFASVDELETKCISPIHETQKEDEGEGGKDGANENINKKGDGESAKHKEYRKSLLSNELKDLKLPHKRVKDRMNLERIRRSELSRSNSNSTMRAASSVSELSVNGTDTEMEYDYYDYDMDNASAVPGSLFGMDPLLLAWVPPFMPVGQVTPPDDGIPLDALINSSTLSASGDTAEDAEGDAVTPTLEGPSQEKPLTLQHFNIPCMERNSSSMEASFKSEEANDRVELQLSDSGHYLERNPSADDDDDLTPTTESCAKILNLDDFQFADDTDEDDT